eukprot:scaffold106868_cov78-Phaeocystis_antarctica.AAC.1
MLVAALQAYPRSHPAASPSPTPSTSPSPSALAPTPQPRPHTLTQAGCMTLPLTRQPCSPPHLVTVPGARPCILRIAGRAQHAQFVLPAPWPPLHRVVSARLRAQLRGLAAIAASAAALFTAAHSTGRVEHRGGGDACPV